MSIKIKVIKAGYYAGKWEEAGAEPSLTERQLECIKRRNREFEILEGAEKGKTISGGIGYPANAKPIEDKKPVKVSVKDLKAALDDKGVEYPANAKKDTLQALLDGADSGESLM